MSPTPVFTYPVKSEAALTSAQLTDMMKWVMNAGALTAWAAVAWTALKVALITAYLVALEKLEAREKERAKQLWDQAQAQANQDVSEQPIP